MHIDLLQIDEICSENEISAYKIIPQYLMEKTD